MCRSLPPGRCRQILPSSSPPSRARNSCRTAHLGPCRGRSALGCSCRRDCSPAAPYLFRSNLMFMALRLCMVWRGIRHARRNTLPLRMTGLNRWTRPQSQQATMCPRLGTRNASPSVRCVYFFVNRRSIYAAAWRRVALAAIEIKRSRNGSGVALRFRFLSLPPIMATTPILRALASPYRSTIQAGGVRSLLL